MPHQFRNIHSPTRTILILAMTFIAFFLLGTGIAIAQKAPVIENGFRGSMRRAPTLVQKAVAGMEGSEETILFRPQHVFFDSEGNLYIADSGQFAVMVYDRDGEFKLRVGREGEGPGEFKMPAASYISWEGELVVEDPGNQRRSFFSLEGEYLRSESLGPVYMGGSPIMTVKGEYARPGQGNVIMRINVGGGGEAEDEPGLLEVIDSGGDVRLKIGSRKTHEERMIGMLLNRISLTYVPPDHLVAGFENVNEIHIYSRNSGELERIITRRLAFNPKEPRMSMQTETSTGPEGGQYTRVVARPDTDPITEHLTVDPEGRIWVLTRLTTSAVADEQETEGDLSGLTRIEVFSLEGELLTTIPLDIFPSRIAFDPFGDLWLLDTRVSIAAYRYEVRWP